MSDKMAYPAVDKVCAAVSIDAKARVKWENRAREAGEGVTTVMAKCLEAAVRDDPFSADDLVRTNAYIAHNLAKREERKIKKGVVQ